MDYLTKIIQNICSNILINKVNSDLLNKFSGFNFYIKRILIENY
jgi:hypothetical protein